MVERYGGVKRGKDVELLLLAASRAPFSILETLPRQHY